MRKSLRTILIDDEKLSTAGLEIDLKTVCPEIDVVHVSNNPIHAIEQIKLLKPDLIFLDIEMPQLNGFELLSAFDEINFKVIFVTAYDEFAVQAFRSHAVDYIMKPLDRGQLREAVDRVLNSMEDGDNFLKIESLIQSLHNNPKSKKLSVPNADGYDLIPIDDIYYCQSSGNYTEIHLHDESKFVTKVLKKIEFALEGYNFHRVHASYLVNLDKVKSIHRNDGGYLIMENGHRITMSRNKKSDVFDKFK